MSFTWAPREVHKCVIFFVLFRSSQSKHDSFRNKLFHGKSQSSGGWSDFLPWNSLLRTLSYFDWFDLYPICTGFSCKSTFYGQPNLSIVFSQRGYIVWTLHRTFSGRFEILILRRSLSVCRIERPRQSCIDITLFTKVLGLKACIFKTMILRHIRWMQKHHSQCRNGACAHYVMVSKFQWKPFWLATQWDSQNDWTATQNRVN